MKPVYVVRVGTCYWQAEDDHGQDVLSERQAGAWRFTSRSEAHAVADSVGDSSARVVRLVKCPPEEVGPLSAAEDVRRKYVPRGEGFEKGWLRVGRYDSARRRALWVRFVGLDDDSYPVKCRAILLCSGREGDDAFVKIRRDNPAFDALQEVLLRAADHVPGRYVGVEPGRHSASPNQEGSGT